MIFLKSIKLSTKNKFLIIGIALAMAGLIPLIILTYFSAPESPYTIEQISLTSEADGTELQALLYRPVNSEPVNGIVVAHGFCGNKQYMQPLSLELVRRGFIVISIDFRGHGSSDGYLPALHRQAKDNPLIGDMMSAVNYLKGLGVKKIGLVGHSMGGRTAIFTSSQHPDEIDAVVSIGMIEQELSLIHI